MDVLEQRGFCVASLDMECCMWAHHDRLLESHSVKNTHWRKQSGEDMSMSDLLQYVGANATSHDVHWPLSLALRPIHLKNFRKRTQAALKRRWERKAAKGYTQWGPPDTRPDRSSGSGGGGGWDDDQWWQWSSWSWSSWRW